MLCINRYHDLLEPFSRNYMILIPIALPKYMECCIVGFRM